MHRKSVFVALAIGLVSVSTAALPTSAATPGATVEVLVGEAPLPVTLPEYLALALTIAEDFAATHSNDVAHPWVDRAGNVIVVPVVSGAGAAAPLRERLTGLAGVRTVQAARSFATLERVKDDAIELSAAPVPGAGAIIATYVDARTNRVVVETNAAPAGLLDVLATRYGADTVVVRAIPGAVRPTLQRLNDASPFRGGARFRGPGSAVGNCTTGFPWRRNATHRMITAGHCASVGGNVTTNTGGAFGNVVNGTGETWNFGVGGGTTPLNGVNVGDIGRIDIGAGLTSNTSIYVGTSASTTTKTILQMATRRSVIGDEYCTGGSFSGELCTWLVSGTNTNFTYSDGTTARGISRGTRATTPCTEGGDSGGPLYSTDGTQVVAKGIHNGTAGALAGVSCTQVFTDIWNAWSAFGGFVNNPMVSDGDRRTSNQLLQPPHFLRSPDGRYTLEMQHDGNLVKYKPGHIAVWATGTNSAANEGAYAVMQNDGNFVIYRPNGAATGIGTASWSTGTSGRTGARIVLQNDCNLVVYTAANQAVWSSGRTGC